MILLLRPALRPRTLGRSGAAAFLDRRAGLPFSLHLGNPFGERLVTCTREKPHDLADMREKIHGFIPGGPAPPWPPCDFHLRTFGTYGPGLVSMSAGPALPVMAVGLVMHRGMQEGHLTASSA